MKNLKDLYDAVKVSEEKVKQVQMEMLTLIDDGTEEGKQKALDLRPALDEAKKAADEANLLYISVRDAEPESDPDAAARMFVPVQGMESKKAKIMTRSEFSAMSAADQMDYMLSGNRLVENQ